MLGLVFFHFLQRFDGGVEFTGGRTYRVNSLKIDKSNVRNAISDRCVNDQGNKIAPEVKTVDNAYILEITTKYLENSVLNKEKSSKNRRCVIASICGFRFFRKRTC